jgi:anti-sigma regulatory factor (Ser/Thr protein kinase)
MTSPDRWPLVPGGSRPSTPSPSPPPTGCRPRTTCNEDRHLHRSSDRPRERVCSAFSSEPSRALRRGSSVADGGLGTAVASTPRDGACSRSGRTGFFPPPAARPPRLAVSSRSCWVTLPKESMEVVLLLTTELVTNAVRHATGPLGLRLARSDEGLLVEVDDRASRLPVVQDLDLDAVSGRGLLLVDKLSDGWGYSPARRVRPCGSGSTRDRDLATRVAQALTPRFTPARRAGRSDRLPPAPGDRAEPGPAGQAWSRSRPRSAPPARAPPRRFCRAGTLPFRVAAGGGAMSPVALETPEQELSGSARLVERVFPRCVPWRVAAAARCGRSAAIGPRRRSHRPAAHRPGEP